MRLISGWFTDAHRGGASSLLLHTPAVDGSLQTQDRNSVNVRRLLVIVRRGTFLPLPLLFCFLRPRAT